MGGNQHKIEKSFSDWCIENNRQDLLDRWDYELNKVFPSQVSYKSCVKRWFKCASNICHKSELFSLVGQIFDQAYFQCKQCNSFGEYVINTYGENALLQYWDYNKNTVDPYKISKGSQKKVWIKCKLKEYHKSHRILVSDFKENFCPYCKGIKVHIKDSFANYHINNTDPDFLNKYWDWEKNNANEVNPWEFTYKSHKSIWIKCQKKSYHESYKVVAQNFTTGDRCSYCGNLKVHYFDSLGYLYPQVLNIWSSKNNLSPYEYSVGSSRKVWFKCDCNNHNDYKRSVDSSIKCDLRCPSCVRERKESILQGKVVNYVLYKYKYIMNHENNCSLVPINPVTNYKLPFDNEIFNLKLIIEVNGKQHYKICGFHFLSAKENNTTPEYELHKQKLYDRYKKYVAFCRGYFYLEIPYWTEKDESYKTLIDSKITEILKLREGGCVG